MERAQLQLPQVVTWGASSDTKVYHDVDLELDTPVIDWAVARLDGMGELARRLAEWVPRKGKDTQSSGSSRIETHSTSGVSSIPRSLAWWDRLRYTIHGTARVHARSAVLRTYAQVLRPSFLACLRSSGNSFDMVRALLAKCTDAREHCNLGFVMAWDHAVFESSRGSVQYHMEGCRVSTYCDAGAGSERVETLRSAGSPPEAASSAPGSRRARAADRSIARESDGADLQLQDSSVEFPLFSYPRVRSQVVLHHQSIGGFLADPQQENLSQVNGLLPPPPGTTLIDSHHLCCISRESIRDCELAAERAHELRHPSTPLDCHNSSVDRSTRYCEDPFVPFRSLGVSWGLAIQVFAVGEGDDAILQTPCINEGIPWHIGSFPADP